MYILLSPIITFSLCLLGVSTGCINVCNPLFRFLSVIEEEDNRRYGFVRFGDQNDQREALIHMSGFLGLGDKAIKLSVATPKPGLSEAASNVVSEASYAGYYEQYWADSAAWGNYGAYQGGGRGGAAAPAQQQRQPHLTTQSQQQQPVLFSGQGGVRSAVEFAHGFAGEEEEGEEDRVIGLSFY